MKEDEAEDIKSAVKKEESKETKSKVKMEEQRAKPNVKKELVDTKEEVKSAKGEFGSPAKIYVYSFKWQIPRSDQDPQPRRKKTQNLSNPNPKMLKW